jgi:hypothetical protein
MTQIFTTQLHSGQWGVGHLVTQSTLHTSHSLTHQAHFPTWHRQTSTSLFPDGGSVIGSNWHKYMGPYFTWQQSLVSSQHYCATLRASMNIQIMELYTIFFLLDECIAYTSWNNYALLHPDQVLMIKFWHVQACMHMCAQACMHMCAHASTQSFINKIYVSNSLTSY